MNRTLAIAGLLGATAVALGAWGAHGLTGSLESLGHAAGEMPRRVDNFNTGVRYQLVVALALLSIGCGEPTLRKRLAPAAWLLGAGGLVFAVLLYAIALGPAAWRPLGAVVPIGGLAMIVGWAVVAIAGFKSPPTASAVGPTPDMADELVRIEEILSHQQRLWQDLDESLKALRDQSDNHAARVARLEEAARQLIEHQRASESIPDERPPHY